MAGFYLGQPHAVRGETDVMDLSNSAPSSVFLCIPSLKVRTDIVHRVRFQVIARQQEAVMQMCVYGNKQKAWCTHVHVHPDVVLFADVWNGDERVKGSVHGCSSCRAHEERYETLRRHKEINDRTIPMCFPSSACLSAAFIAEVSTWIALPSVWPPVFSSQGQLGSFCRCKEGKYLVASWVVCEFISGGRIL